MQKILIVDHSKNIRNKLRECLEFEGFYTESIDSEDSAAELCQKDSFDLIITEQSFNMKANNVPFIILSSELSVDSAMQAIHNGASDYITKPVDLNKLLIAIRNTVKPSQNMPEIEIKKIGSPPTVLKISNNDIIIGSSRLIKRVHHMIDVVAPSDARVLITGENGTGKELVARNLHLKSKRSAAVFVEVNCAAIPSELIESELFGHEKGAFTSAIKQRKGKFEQADGGTLFLDEIGDMSLSAQAKVLRVLQEGKVTRVGSDKDISVDVRVVAATNKNLKQEIANNNFREDLYHRLSVIVMKVPPLRERADDIPLLVDHFMEKICNGYAIPRKSIGSQALKALCEMPWSGNIRELRNVVERLIILSGDKITKADVVEFCNID